VATGGQALVDHDRAVDAAVLDWFGSLVIDAEAIRLLGFRTLAKAQKGMESTEQSILKLFGSESVQRSTLQVLEALGPAALDPTQRTLPLYHLDSEAHGEPWFDRYIRSFAGTIAGGTSQIQRNIIAERVLGLPR
jgi:alkylation response protein AidB-like acyl-CoA dehydrogenase